MTLCPHCGKEIVTPAYAEPVNTAGPQAINFWSNVNGCAAQPYPIITNTVCATAAQPGITHYITLGIDDKR